MSNLTSFSDRGLHVFVSGQGDPLVLLHGWGMNSSLLRELAESLSDRYRVYRVDLPGHGLSKPVPSFDLEHVLPLMESVLPPDAHWVGWSLGGLISAAMAERAPNRVRSLTFLASSPCFVSEGEWPGISAELLDQMGRDFVTDYGATLSRFVGLQTFGQVGGRQLARHVLSRLEEAPTPNPSNLIDALGLLKMLDFRAMMSRLPQPVLMILGAKDRLVPVALGGAMAGVMPSLRIKVIGDAAHIPFATHPEEVAEEIRDFLGSLKAGDVIG